MPTDLPLSSTSKEEKAARELDSKGFRSSPATGSSVNQVTYHLSKCRMPHSYCRGWGVCGEEFLVELHEPESKPGRGLGSSGVENTRGKPFY